MSTLPTLCITGKLGYEAKDGITDQSFLYRNYNSKNNIAPGHGELFTSTYFDGYKLRICVKNSIKNRLEKIVPSFVSFVVTKSRKKENHPREEVTVIAFYGLHLSLISV